MSKPSNRDKLLAEGFRVVYERGFVGASVRDITRAAGVPQGSFTNHFTSKEAFCLEVLETYFLAERDLLARSVLDTSLAPLERVRRYIDANLAIGADDQFKNGCLIGNFSIESTAHSDLIRRRLMTMYAEIESSIAVALKAAVVSGDLPKGTRPEVLAGFVTGSLQGAILRAKVERDAAPRERFREVLYTTVLNMKYARPKGVHARPKPEPARLPKPARKTAAAKPSRKPARS